MPERVSIPRELAGLSIAQTSAILKILNSMSVDIKRLIRNVERENQIQEIRNRLRGIVNEGIDDIGGEIYKYSKEARGIAIKRETNFLKLTPLPRLDINEWNKYLSDAQKVVNLSVDAFMTKKSYIDGKTLSFRLTTIKRGTSNVVEAILRNSIRDGKSAFQVGKEIENYLKKDGRKRWVSPYTIKRREQGFPISSPYTGGVPAGAVDYNAMRIARTELINNYRWATIDSTKGKDWLIGWRWSLSLAHPKADICNEWAEHNEGFGVGVYTNPREIASLGHPHCFCQVEPVTIFHDEMKPYFEKAYKDLGTPIQKYQG